MVTLEGMNPRLAIVLFTAGLLSIAAVALALVGSRGSDAETPVAGSRFEGALMPPRVPAPELGLRDQDGRRVTMAELRGRPVLVTFLYSHCEESCPAEVQQIKGALDDLGRDYPAVAISVDPERDTPESARHFLAEQGMTGRMRFVLGTREELRRLWKGYFVTPQTRRQEHMGRIVLLDGRGMQRVGFPVEQATPDRLAHDVELLARGV